MIYMPEQLATRSNREGVFILKINDDLDGYRIRALKSELAALISQKHYKIIVGLENVRFINAKAVGALVGTATRARQRGGDLKLYGLSSQAKRVFELVNAAKFLEIYSSEEEAVNSF